MTTQETFDFSAYITNSRMYIDKLRSPLGKRLKLDTRKNTPVVEMVQNKLGVAHVAETPIGDELLRGVSGGERKRVEENKIEKYFGYLAR